MFSTDSEDKCKRFSLAANLISLTANFQKQNLQHKRWKLLVFLFFWLHLLARSGENCNIDTRLKNTKKRMFLSSAI